MREPNRERDVVCPCGATFKTRHSQGKYCSARCSRQGARASWRDYGDRNRQCRRAYHRTYYLANRSAVLARTTAYSRTPAGRAAQRRSDERQREKFPEKYAARQAVLVAVRAGRLKKWPCKCGNPKTEAHHRDYSKPLEVEWLCRRCHDVEGGLAIGSEA